MMASITAANSSPTIEEALIAPTPLSTMAISKLFDSKSCLVCLYVWHCQQMSRNMRSSSAPRASLSRYRGVIVAVAGDIVVVKALQMRPL